VFFLAEDGSWCELSTAGDEGIREQTRDDDDFVKLAMLGLVMLDRY